SIFAVFSIIYFIFLLNGTIKTLPSNWDAISWHRHEMLFGFSGAVIAGFLLTAVPNWTGHPTLKGLSLAMLVLMWLAGRVLVFFSSYIPNMIVAVVDASFFIGCIIGIMPALVKSRNKRNYIFLVFLTLLAIANALTHSDDYADIGIVLARNIVLMMIVVIGGRVIPFFTKNALGIEITSNQYIEYIAIFSTAITFILEVLNANYIILVCFFLLASIANILRMFQWQSLKTMRVPLLWILHLGYAWITLGLAIKAAYYLGASLPISITTHALTVGGIGILILGMMSRVSLGHSGRPLVIRRCMVFAFISIFAAAIARVFGVVLFPDNTMIWLEIAALFWVIAFGIFVYIYTPILTSPRPTNS
ncbi:MAG: NnrS family protein, partial [Rickettsiales bacterium]